MAETGDAGFLVVPLICRACNTKMTGNEDQVIYQCGGCRKSYELSGGKLCEQNVIHLSGCGDTRLPFWRVTFRMESSRGNIESLKAFVSFCGSVKNVEDRGHDLPTLLIPSSNIAPPQAVRLGKNIAARSPEFTPHYNQDFLFEPVVISRADILPMAELILLSAVVDARRSDPDFLHSFKLILTSPELVTLPFELKGIRLYQADLNLEVF